MNILASTVFVLALIASSTAFSQEITKEQVKNACEEAKSDSAVAKCLIASYKLKDTKLDYSYLEAISSDISGMSAGASCSNHIETLKKSLQSIDKSDLGKATPIEDCNFAANVFFELTWLYPPYFKCKLESHSFEQFENCTGFLNQNERIDGVKRLLSLLIGQNITHRSFDYSKGRSPFDAWVSINDSSRIAATSRILGGEFEGCSKGSELAYQRRNKIAVAFATTRAGIELNADEARRKQIADEAYKSVTCADLAQVLAKYGHISKAEASAVVSASSGSKGFDRCAATRKISAPLVGEIQTPTSAMIPGRMCTLSAFSEDFQMRFLTAAGSAGTEISMIDGQCVRRVLGFAIATHRFVYEPNQCANEGPGKARCSGTLTSYCTGTDRARQALDCATQNFEVKVQSTYEYDEKACDWKPMGVSVDRNSRREVRYR